MGVSISTKWISYNPIAIENSLFDIKTLQKKWTKPILNLRIEKDILFSLQESFSFFDIKTGNYLWSFLLSDSYNFYRKSNYENTPDDFCQAEIVRIIGEYNNILWIVLNSGRLLGLEVETGKLKYDLIKPINFIEEIDGFDVALWAMIDIEKGQIFGIKKHCYFEIDLKNSQESYYFYDISETCQQHQIEADYPSYELVWEGDEIFIGKNELHYDKHPCNVGIFNRITKQITWTSRELKNENIFKGISKIEYANNKLFVLDRESTLHIFER
jgi:outer membrane protein assembly factor BamB